MAIIRTITTTCDRCGKILENRTDERRWCLRKRIFNLKYEDSSNWKEKDNWTLCCNCVQNLKKWLKNDN